jgi:hypothetical protein
MDFVGAGGKAGDAGEDVISRLSPDEGFRISAWYPKHQDPDRQSYLSRDRDHGVFQEQGHIAARAGAGQPRLARTTKLYDRRQDEISLDEVEKISI